MPSTADAHQNTYWPTRGKTITAWTVVTLLIVAALVAAIALPIQCVGYMSLCGTYLELASGALHKSACGRPLAFKSESGASGSARSGRIQSYFPPSLALSPDQLEPVAWDALHKIPKLIWRTAADSSWTTNCRSAFDLTAKTNPDWQQHVFTDADVLEYIHTAYASVPEIVQVADKIQLGVLLADLWRLLIVYDKGGLYLDLKCPAVRPLESALSLATDKVYVGHWHHHECHRHLFESGELTNWVFMAPPRNSAVWAAVCRVVANLRALQTHEDHDFMAMAEHGRRDPKSRVLCTTGPIAFTSALLDEPHAIQIVNPYLNGAVQYAPPVASEALDLRPNHYSKYTGRFLKPAVPPQECVPRILHISWTSRAGVPEKVWDNLAKFVPADFDVRFYSDQDCADFMAKQDAGGKIAHLYSAIKQGAHKADAFRYAVLYQFGGVWLDIKTVLLQPLCTFIDLTVPFTTALTATTKVVYQGILACAPKMAIMTQCLADVLMYGTPRHLRLYHTGLRFLTAQLKGQLSARHGARESASKGLRIGRNLGVRFDFDLLAEIVKPGHGDNRDRYGFDANIFDAKGRNVVKTRYNDFPWA